RRLTPLCPASSTNPNPKREGSGCLIRKLSKKRARPLPDLALAQIRPQRARDLHAPVRALVVLEHGDEGPSHGHRRAIQRMCELGLPIPVLEPDVRPARLEVLAV